MSDTEVKTQTYTDMIMTHDFVTFKKAPSDFFEFTLVAQTDRGKRSIFPRHKGTCGPT